MNKIIKIFFLIIFLSQLPSYCLDIKKINPFKKKPKPEKVKMVETKQEWEIEAQNIPINERKKTETIKSPESDKKNYYPERHYIFEKYNYPVGTREVNINFIKKNLVEHPIITADLKCQYVAYANYYYSPDVDQITSDFFIGKLDTTKNKTNRILEYNHKQIKKEPIIKSGLNQHYSHLFSGLSLVDWSNDSKKVLIKEKIGSTIAGIYQTYLYIHFIDTNTTIKLEDFNKTIENYFTDYENFNLIQYKYTIIPLGFSADNDDIIIAHCFIYDNEGNKLFMGTWGYDINERQTLLFSKTNPSISISSNGLVLKQVLE